MADPDDSPAAHGPSVSASKLGAYQELVDRRKACRLCDELVNPSVVDSGAHDSDEIGPYSRWQGNLDAKLLIVGQDFADVKTFRKLMGWPNETGKTNKMLVELLAEAGLTVPMPHKGVSDDNLFLTNGVLCLKQGGMQARVGNKCFDTCGKELLAPIIRLIKPLAVVTLGMQALRAVLTAYGMKRPSTLTKAVDRVKPIDLPGGARLFPRFHPSQRVLRKYRKECQQREDWRRLRDWLHASRGSNT